MPRSTSPGRAGGASPATTPEVAAALCGLALLGAGCPPPPEAPEELSELSRYLFREWPAEDPRVLGVGAGNLEGMLLDLDLEGDVHGRAFEPTDLEEADVAGIEHPDAPVGDCLPVAVAGRSEHPIDLHARFMLEVDQSPAEPSASYYERTFVDPADPSCFPTADCDRMSTINDIVRSNLLYTIGFVLPKDYRWVEVMVDGQETGRRAIVARSWTEETFVSDDGDTVMVQTFTLDVWIEVDDTDTLRYQVLYSQVEIPGDPADDLIRGVTVYGIGDAFEAADEALEEMYGA